MIYKLVRNPMTNEIDTVNKITEGRIVCIPFDEANTDYQEYLEWLAEGNTPEEAE
jgi:hypothetical protein